MKAIVHPYGGEIVCVVNDTANNFEFVARASFTIGDAVSPNLRFPELNGGVRRTDLCIKFGLLEPEREFSEVCPGIAPRRWFYGRARGQNAEKHARDQAHRNLPMPARSSLILPR